MSKQCWQCGEAWSDKTQPGGRELCLRCDAPLHCCRNCKFYEANAREWCREPMARSEKPRDVEAANTCSFFLFGERADADEACRREAKAKEALSALFGEPAPPREIDSQPDWMKTDPPDAAKNDDLFKP